MMASNVSRDVSQDQSSVVQTCKPWYAFATVAAGRFVRFASRVTKHGGSALPGKVVEKIDPGFLTRTLGQLPLGVVLVSGTNGKTTTTRMVASMLSDLGLKVFTNPDRLELRARRGLRTAYRSHARRQIGRGHRRARAR